jgi:Holliday junction resolvase RusA-like endonuclease
VKITIPIHPVAKARARTVTNNGYTHSFTPKKTKDAEDYIRAFVTGYPKYDPTTPLAVSVTFYVAKPKSCPKRQYPTVKPDIDNYLKLVCDALNGKVWEDQQIVRILARKEYGDPRIELEVEVLK